MREVKTRSSQDHLSFVHGTAAFNSVHFIQISASHLDIKTPMDISCHECGLQIYKNGPKKLVGGQESHFPEYC